MKTTIELPCAVGDKAFYVSKNGIEEVEVEAFIFNINLFANVSFYICGEHFERTLTPYKTLFFTQEEAEKMWKQLKSQDSME